MFRIERPGISIYDLVETQVRPEGDNSAEVFDIPEGAVIAELSGGGPSLSGEALRDIRVDKEALEMADEFITENAGALKRLAATPTNDWLDLTTGDAVLRSRPTRLNAEALKRARAVVALSIAEDLEREREEVLRDSVYPVLETGAAGLQDVPEVSRAEVKDEAFRAEEGASFEKLQ